MNLLLTGKDLKKKKKIVYHAPPLLLLRSPSLRKPICTHTYKPFRALQSGFTPQYSM